MSGWAITFETVVIEPVGDDQVDRLVTAMSAHGGAVSVAAERLGVTFTVDEAANVQDALERGSEIWRVALLNCDIHAGIDVAAEAMTVEEQDRRLEQPVMPEIWGTVEVAGELGVSRQRVHQLVAEHSRFPEPLVRLGAGPLWLADTIRAFNATWERKPGRPRAVPDSPVVETTVVSVRKASPTTATRTERKERLAARKAAVAARAARKAAVVKRADRKAAAAKVRATSKRKG